MRQTLQAQKLLFLTKNHFIIRQNLVLRVCLNHTICCLPTSIPTFFGFEFLKLNPIQFVMSGGEEGGDIGTNYKPFLQLLTFYSIKNVFKKCMFYCNDQRDYPLSLGFSIQFPSNPNKPGSNWIVFKSKSIPILMESQSNCRRIAISILISMPIAIESHTDPKIKSNLNLNLNSDPNLNSSNVKIVIHRMQNVIPQRSDISFPS